jgi:F-type H+-transporting ATPase subunit b
MTIATSNFLIPNFTFVVELVAFLIVLGVLGKYVLPYMNQMLNQRIEKIRGELQAADEAKADANAADEERRTALEQARQQAREILATANRTADQVSAESVARAQAEYDRILSAAESDVRLARQRALEEASVHLGELVVDVVERIIGREVSAESHRDLINEAISALADEGSVPGAAGAGASGAAGQP